jgi:hypothetical protein
VGTDKPMGRFDAVREPMGLLGLLVGAFESRGWLHRAVRIRRGERRYRICCSETEFSVHRINDHCRVLPGFSCWAVCMVTRSRIIEDSELSPFATAEPTATDWLRHIKDGDFETL